MVIQGLESPSIKRSMFYEKEEFLCILPSNVLDSSVVVSDPNGKVGDDEGDKDKGEAFGRNVLGDQHVAGVGDLNRKIALSDSRSIQFDDLKKIIIIGQSRD